MTAGRDTDPPLTAAEAALRASEQRYRMLFEQAAAAERAMAEARAELDATLAAMPDLLFDVDDEGRIYDFRAPRPELLAVPPAQFLGRTMHELLPPDVGAAVQAGIDAAARDGRSSGTRYQLGVAGGARTFEMAIARKATAGGRPRFICLARDVTEAVEADAARRALEAQLRQTQKLEALGTLAGGIAHDFNNQLAAITLGLVELRRVVGDPASAAALRGVELAVRRASDLVQQILAFGRQRVAARTVVAANDAVGEAAALLRSTLPAGARLTLAPAPDAPHVEADPTQLQQVLINLGTNAWQALADGRGTIALEVATVAAPPPPLAGPAVRVTVRDDGVGMDAATVDRIFEPYFTTRGPGRGSGLGLAVVHGIVVEHGGAITVDSAVGRGTTVAVYLPWTAAPAAPPPAPPPLAAPPGLRVVCVDDERFLADTVAHLLRELGAEARSFTDPAAALAAIVAAPDDVDLVLTDLTMPTMSGLELARAIHALRPTLPIVLASGHVMESAAALAEVGVVRTLQKPFDLVQLVAALTAAAPRAAVSGSRAAPR